VDLSSVVGVHRQPYPDNVMVSGCSDIPAAEFVSTGTRVRGFNRARRFATVIPRRKTAATTPAKNEKMGFFPV